MIKIKHSKEQLRLRRIALSTQGLLQQQPYGKGLAGARKAINHIGYVQIDAISVVERAHHHVIYSIPKPPEDARFSKTINDGILGRRLMV